MKQSNAISSLAILVDVASNQMKEQSSLKLQLGDAIIINVKILLKITKMINDKKYASDHEFLAYMYNSTADMLNGIIGTQDGAKFDHIEFD